MPVTSRGKLDRKRLPPPPADLGMGEGDFVPCESRTEKVIEAVWQELLGYDAVSYTHLTLPTKA